MTINGLIIVDILILVLILLVGAFLLPASTKTYREKETLGDALFALFVFLAALFFISMSVFTAVDVATGHYNHDQHVGELADIHTGGGNEEVTIFFENGESMRYDYGANNVPQTLTIGNTYRIETAEYGGGKWVPMPTDKVLLNMEELN